MVTRDYKAKEYHKMVWKAARDATIEYYRDDWENSTGNFVVAVISGLAYAVWSYTQGGAVIDWLGVVASVLIGFVGWGLIVFLKNLVWKMPAKLFREKEVAANKYTWNDVSVTIPTFSPDSIIFTGLSVSNSKPYDIQSAIVKVTNIQKDRFLFEPYIGQETLPLNLCWLTNGEGFTWGGRKLHKNGEEPRVLVVAGWLVPDRPPLLMTGYAEENSRGNPKHIDLEVNSNYIIELQWFGAVDGHPLDEFTSRYHLKFDGQHFHLKELK